MAYESLRAARNFASNGKEDECADQLASLVRTLDELRAGRSLGAPVHPWRTTNVCAEVSALARDAARYLDGRREGLVVALSCLDEAYFKLYYNCSLLPRPTGGKKSKGGKKNRASRSVPSPSAHFAGLLTDEHRAAASLLLSSISGTSVCARVGRFLGEAGEGGFGGGGGGSGGGGGGGGGSGGSGGGGGGRGNSGGGSTSSSNPLLRLWALRFLETAALFGGDGKVPPTPRSASAAAASAPAPADDDWPGQSKASPPLCGDLSLRRWRDACRDWPAHVYAYAVPTREALLAVLCPSLDFCDGDGDGDDDGGGKGGRSAPHSSSSTPSGLVVECGAGTGYWASLLKQEAGQEAEVVALDISPTTRGAGREGGKKRASPSGGFNEYHGACPAFTEVLRGGPSAVAELTARHKQSECTLFLCYPPPGDAMALRALRAFGGIRVAHVGEFQGTTGTVGFEEELCRDFYLAREVPLPQFGNTANALTIWRRRRRRRVGGGGGGGAGGAGGGRKGDRPPRPHPGLRCLACGLMLGEGGGSGDCGGGSSDRAAVRRCSFSRSLCFCSTACASEPSARREWRAELALRFAVAAPGTCLGIGNDSDNDNDKDADNAYHRDLSHPLRWWRRKAASYGAPRPQCAESGFKAAAPKAKEKKQKKQEKQKTQKTQKKQKKTKKGKDEKKKQATERELETQNAKGTGQGKKRKRSTAESPTTSVSPKKRARRRLKALKKARAAGDDELRMLFQTLDAETFLEATKDLVG